VHLGTEARTRADRFYAAQGWTREGMIDEVEVEVEVGYRLRRADRPGGDPRVSGGPLGPARG